MLSNMFLALLSFLAALGTALPTSPTTTTITSNAQVFAHTFTENNCGGTYTILHITPNQCVDFAPGVKSLRVVGHDGELRYNALNIHSALDCHSGPVLQPLGRSCSQVVAFKSIKLVI